MKLKTKTFYVTDDKSGGSVLMLVGTLTDVTNQSLGSVTDPGILLDEPHRQLQPVAETYLSNPLSAPSFRMRS